MIKIDSQHKPAELTESLQSELTQKFKDTGEDVWNIPWLKDAILAKSHKKCCYSEIHLNRASTYMEIDHFYPKSLYPNEVLSWENLLPSCKKCNATKRNHDTIKEPIINPFVDNPKDYFYFENSFYRARENNEKAKLSIKKLGLNDIEHFVEDRDDISKQTEARLKDLYKIIVFHKDFSSVESLKQFLETGKHEAKYSALVSTVILSDENFQHIENQLKTNNLWDNELEELKQELEYCALLK